MVVICKGNNEHNNIGEEKIGSILLDILSLPLIRASSCGRGSALSLVIVSRALRVTSSFHSFADAVEARRTFGDGHKPMLFSVRKCDPPLLMCDSANNPATLAAGFAAEPSQTCSVAALQCWGVA